MTESFHKKEEGSVSFIELPVAMEHAYICVSSIDFTSVSIFSLWILEPCFYGFSFHLYLFNLAMLFLFHTKGMVIFKHVKCHVLVLDQIKTLTLFCFSFITHTEVITRHNVTPFSMLEFKKLECFYWKETR
jgi:hypothetical protein